MSIKKLLLPLTLILTLSILSGCDENQTVQNLDDKVLMAVFAHPDDESLVGPILYQYANRGVEVILVTATDGRLGFTDFSGIDDSDELAAVRRDELRCTADLLGVELIHLDYEDQFAVSGGHGSLMAQTRGLILDLHNIIEEKKPDAIITFGPDGFSNHMDHRLTGITVTQVVLSKEWEKTPDIYYYGVPSSMLEGDEFIFMGVEDRYLTVSIPFTQDELEVAREAALCHSSQFTPDFVDQWITLMQQRGNRAFFRPFVPSDVHKSGFFE